MVEGIRKREVFALLLKAMVILAAAESSFIEEYGEE